jgi:hypothetical protein
VVVHRSDGSGTTSNFTKYLKAAAPSTWTLDAGDTVNWPTTTQAGNGNAGVAQAITAADGAIGYVDLSDATASKLTFASIKNKDGNFVAPTLDGATAALANAEVKDNLTYSALNVAGADAYPITARHVHPRLRQADRRHEGGGAEGLDQLRADRGPGARSGLVLRTAAGEPPAEGHRPALEDHHLAPPARPPCLGPADDLSSAGPPRPIRYP